MVEGQSAVSSFPSIGELARRFGVRCSALRYYEARGLLRPTRTGKGYRVYGEDAVSALRFIRRADRQDAPAESGNFSGGFAPSALQAYRYRRFRHREGRL